MIIILFLFNLYTSSDINKIDNLALEAIYNSGNYELLINLSDLINNKEKDINIIKLLAKAYLKLNKLELAKETTVLGINKDKTWFEGHKILSFIYYKENNLKEALSYIQIFVANTTDKTIEEKYYIASLYKEANIDSNNFFIELIKDIENTKQFLNYIDIYAEALENTNNFEKAIKIIELKDDTCEKYKKLNYLYEKANIIIDADTLTNYMSYCNIADKKLYKVKTSSYIDNIHSRDFNYFNFNLKNEFLVDNLSSYINYNLYKYSLIDSETYNSLSLGFTYTLFDKFNFNIEVEKFIEFKPKYTPLYFNFSYDLNYNNFNFYYYNYTDMLISKNFYYENIEAKELNFYNFHTYSDFLSFELNLNYKQTFNKDSKYTNIYNNKLNIYSKLKNANPFTFGLGINSLYIDKYNDFNNIFINQRFIGSFIFKYNTNYSDGFNLDLSFIIGDDLHKKDKFLEIFEFNLSPTYNFSKNSLLKVNIAYFTIIEAKYLEYGFNSFLSFNYSF